MKKSIGLKLCCNAILALLAVSISAQAETPYSAQNEPTSHWLSVVEGNITTGFTENDGYTDLKGFGDAIGDKRIVTLDEATHGDGNIFALKSRLVKYLHEEKGFNVFLLESALFDVSRIWMNDSQPITAQAPGNIFYMYANSSEVQPLFQYIDARRNTGAPLYFAGFDNRHTGGLSNSTLMSSLETYLSTSGSTILNDKRWSSFKASLVNLISGKAANSNAEQQKHFFDLASEISAFTSPANETDMKDVFNSSGFWHRIIQSVKRMADVAWKKQSIAVHDIDMAANIKWLLETVYPGQKVIIWGQYVHLSPNGNPDHTDGAPDPNVGTELRRLWPGEVYSVHFGGGKGTYTDFITLQEKAISTPPSDSLEAALAERGISTVFINQHSLDLNSPASQYATMLTYHYDETERVPVSNWSNHWDGMFFINPITPVDYIQR